MIEPVFIFTVAMIPPVVSVWMMRQAQAEANSRLQQAIENVAIARLVRVDRHEDEPPEFDEVLGEVLGDRSCQYNAHSPYIRCAVNPQGPCEGCPHYQSTNDAI
jgi:hypothetical protein